MMDVTFGFMGSGRVVDQRLPDPGMYASLAATVDRLGFESLWVGDHISTHNPVPEAVVMLTAFASWTRRVRLGSGVLLAALRHPSLTAKQFATLDWLSGGRVILGVGVGGEDVKDFEAVQVPVGERGARTTECLDAIRTLWSGRTASFHGRYYSFEDVQIQPSPVQAGGPPIWLAGRSPAALRRVGRLGDAWYSYMVSPNRFAEGMSMIRQTVEEAGRDEAAVTGAVLIPTLIGPSKEQAVQKLQQHLSSRYAKPYSTQVVENYCLAGTPEQIRERIESYVDAGVRHLVFMPATDASGLEDAAIEFDREIMSPMLMKEPSWT